MTRPISVQGKKNIGRGATAIPQKFNDQIMERLFNGETQNQIAAWLEKEHGIKVNPRTVGTRIAIIEKQREPLAREILKDKLESHIGQDLEMMRNTLNKLDRVFNALGQKMDTDAPEGNLESLIGRVPRASVLANLAREKLAYLTRSLEISGVSLQNGQTNNTNVQIVLPPEEDSDHPTGE